MSAAHQVLLVGGGGSLIASPLEIAGCAFWLDASDASSVTPNTNGASLSQANDKSGNGFHVLQGTGGLKPTYVFTVQNGRNIIRFTGAEFMSRAGFGFLNGVPGWTVFTVTKPTAHGGTEQSALTALYDSNFFRCLFAANVTATNGFSTSGGRRSSGDTLATTTDSTARSTSAFEITATIATFGGALTQYLANVQTSQNASYQTAGNMQTTNKTLILGADFGSPLQDPFIGDIAEVIVYGAALSVADASKVYQYLRGKWGL